MMKLNLLLLNCILVAKVIPFATSRITKGVHKNVSKGVPNKAPTTESSTSFSAIAFPPARTPSSTKSPTITTYIGESLAPTHDKSTPVLPNTSQSPSISATKKSIEGNQKSNPSTHTTLPSSTPTGGELIPSSNDENTAHKTIGTPAPSFPADFTTDTPTSISSETPTTIIPTKEPTLVDPTLVPTEPLTATTPPTPLPTSTSNPTINVTNEKPTFQQTIGVSTRETTFKPTTVLTEQPTLEPTSIPTKDEVPAEEQNLVVS